jgi:cyclopropane-fatty-acyl-phospholipid synthase
MFPLSHLLRRFVRNGRMTVIDPAGAAHVFGGIAPGPQVTMRLTDPALPRKLFLNPELHAGEAYMDGTLVFEEGGVETFLQLFAANRTGLGSHPLQSALRRIWRALRATQQYNPLHKAREHVAHHYDLSERLYELFLDSDRQYSCAYFLNPDDDLETAQLNKRRHIAAKLCLADGQRVLDIGCGWGGMALFLAQLKDVHVTGITLSQEQLAVAQRRAAAAGLSDRVAFRLQDYREVTGTFDRIVSVGMFEHVGTRYYRAFFRQVFSLLADDGVALLHAIGRMAPPGTTSPWIRKYIFPGGYTPSLSEVFAATEEAHLWVTDLEVLRLHYAETLRHWYRRFLANRDEIRALYDERFCRMWEFYLLSAEYAFRTGSQMVFQMQLARRRDAAPLVRDYMVDDEREMRRAGAAAGPSTSVPQAATTSPPG